MVQEAPAEASTASGLRKMIILEQHPLHYPGEPLRSTHCVASTVLGTVGESGSKDLPSRMSQREGEQGLRPRSLIAPLSLQPHPLLPYRRVTAPISRQAK